MRDASTSASFARHAARCVLVVMCTARAPSARAEDRTIGITRRNAQSTAPADEPSSSRPPSLAIERVPADTARTILWPSRPPDTHACDAAAQPIECLLALRWSAVPDALAAVTALWRDLGVVCGVERTYVMDGAYRGYVHIVPQLPIGPYARHLAWLDRALRDQDAFYRAVAARAPRPTAYRWTGLGIRFFRSTNTHTPAGYATDWDFAYNVVGGINDSPERVRLTVIHEVFHLNDAAHGQWSSRVLEPIYTRILHHCGHDTACLAPYAPVLLRVRRTGMFYAFQSGNSDVGEYAAMLAERYYLEVSGQWQGRPFRCGPPENAAAWRAIADEFFGGNLATSACPP